MFQVRKMVFQDVEQEFGMESEEICGDTEGLDVGVVEDEGANV